MIGPPLNFYIYLVELWLIFFEDFDSNLNDFKGGIAGSGTEITYDDGLFTSEAATHIFVRDSAGNEKRIT